MATGSICAGGTLGILIPPSVTFILYGIATETSIGRLFLAGVVPEMMLTGFFILWTAVHRLEARLPFARAGFPLHVEAEVSRRCRRSRRSSRSSVGVMYVLYGGVATPSEAAGVGAALCVIMAVVIYRHVEGRTSGGRSCATPCASP